MILCWIIISIAFLLSFEENDEWSTSKTPKSLPRCCFKWYNVPWLVPWLQSSRQGRLRTIEDVESGALLVEEPCQTQIKLISTLEVIHQAIPKRLHALEMIQKQEIWFSYGLKSRNVKIRFFICKQLLQRQKSKGFLHRIVTNIVKCILYSNSKPTKLWRLPGHASTSSARPYIHVAKA